ncbi:MAG: flagellar biosynthesis protein FliQ [bacterium]
MENLVLKISREALLLVLILSGPPVLISLIVGLIISIFQAATQIQEQTITFVPKIIVVFLTLIICGNWLMELMVRFTNNLFTTFPNYIK